MRAIAALQAAGWLQRKCGDRADNVKLALCMPPLTELSNASAIDDSIVSPGR
jgi:hypothetical protein